MKIATQSLQNDKPGQFFEVTYSIPEELTRGKTKITVRFQARSGNTAGGFYGPRDTRNVGKRSDLVFYTIGSFRGL